MSLFQELRRRNVFRVAAAYAVVTWLVLQVLDVVAPILELPGWLPRAVLLLLVVGFPIALIVAWAFELTPEGIKREADVDRSQSIATQTGQRLNRLIIGGLMLVIVLLVVERTMFAGRDAEISGEFERSVAVLPFADLSEGGDQEWFADGLAEEILNALVRTPDLLVSSRTSSFAFKNSKKAITEIAGVLGVAHVLEGSVRRSGERLRVTAQLIRAQDGFHVWSENYDRDAADVIDIQEDLAISIARALETTMDPEALERMSRVGTRSVTAYEHYLEGVALYGDWQQDPVPGLNWQAYEAFEKAREIDPEFSDAHAWAAINWVNQLSISTRGVAQDLPPLSEMMTRYRLRMQAAIETAQDPVDKEVYEGSLALVEMRLRDAARHLEPVLVLRPSDANLIDDLFNVAIYLSDEELLQRVSDHAYSLWDKVPELAINYIQFPFRIGGKVSDPAQFVSRILQTVQRYPTPGMAYQAQRSLLWMGEVESARSMLPLMEGVIEGQQIVAARQACAEGRRSDAEAALLQIDPDITDYDRAAIEWHLLMLLGRNDEANAVLRPFETIASPLTVGAYLTYPHFDPSSFPVVMDILERENIDRPEPVNIPFGCPPETGPANSVAILPFANLSSDKEQEYFADGLAEEILNALAQLPELLVTARTSSFFFKGKDVPVDEIAERLGVENILEGSVRRAGDDVRITAQLIRADDGFHLWSQSYDATLENVFEVQTDIAEKVVVALDILLDEEKRALMEASGVRNPEAFALFAKGFELHRLGHTELPQLPALAEAREYFEQATELAPELWAAYLFSADLQWHIMLREALGRPVTEIDPELVESVRQEHDRLLGLASRHAPNPAARDYVDLGRRVFSNDWTGLGVLSRTIFSHTQACGYDQWTHLLGAAYGRAQEAYEFYIRAARCNAVDESNWIQAGMAALYAGRPELALGAAEQGLARANNKVDIEDMRAIALIAAGRYEEADVVAARGLGMNTGVTWAEAFSAAALGDADRLAALEASSDPNSERRAYLPLQFAAWSGDLESANIYAAAMDARPFGPTALLIGIHFCMCGAPFDISVTPNFKALFEQTGFDWPPVSPVELPLKTW